MEPEQGANKQAPPGLVAQPSSYGLLPRTRGSSIASKATALQHPAKKHILTRHIPTPSESSHSTAQKTKRKTKRNGTQTG